MAEQHTERLAAIRQRVDHASPVGIADARWLLAQVAATQAQLVAAELMATALGLVLTDVLVSAHQEGCPANYGYARCRCGWPGDRAEIEAALAAWRQSRRKEA